jgi:hypothetical protein
MVWDPAGKEWVRQAEASDAGDVQPGGAHNATKTVPNVGVMLWEATKKEWIPASSGNTKDGESAAEALPVQNLLFNEVAGTMDRQRNNSATVELWPSETHAAAVQKAITNYNARGIQIELNITAAGTGYLALNVLDFAGHYAGISVQPITGATPLSHSFTIYPGIAAYPKPTEGPVYLVYPAGEHNATIPGVIARNCQLQVAPSEAVNWTWSLSYQLLV